MQEGGGEVASWKVNHANSHLFSLAVKRGERNCVVRSREIAAIGYGDLRTRPIADSEKRGKLGGVPVISRPPPSFYPSLFFWEIERRKLGQGKSLGGIIDGPEDKSKTFAKICSGLLYNLFLFGEIRVVSHERDALAPYVVVRLSLSSSSSSFPAKFVPWELPFPPAVKFQLPEGGRRRSKGGGSKESNDCLIHLSALVYACQVSGLTNMYFSSNL